MCPTTTAVETFAECGKGPGDVQRCRRLPLPDLPGQISGGRCSQAHRTGSPAEGKLLTVFRSFFDRTDPFLTLPPASTHTRCMLHARVTEQLIGAINRLRYCDEIAVLG